MSMSYWSLQGVGLNAEELKPYLNTQRCIDLYRKIYPDEEINLSDADDEDFLFRDMFDNIGDLLWCADESNTLSYSCNGDGVWFFLYEPTFPWNRNENEPRTLQEAHKLLIDAVVRVCDLDRTEVERMIDDDLYEYGFG